MPILSVSDLLTVTTQADALALELSICAALGLPTSAWQPLSAEMAILGANSQIVSTFSIEVNQIAQGGFPSSAATIAATGSTNNDGSGFLTTWMDLCLTAYYNVTRIPSAFATGPMSVVNTSATSYPFVVGQLHFQNPITGATYSNLAVGTIAASGTTTIQVQADAGFPGGSGTMASGIPILLTPLSGVTPQPLTVPLVGTNIETNAAALSRGQAKLGSLSPDGAAQAYVFVATSIPTPASRAAAPFPFSSLVTSANIPITVTAPITRAATQLNPSSGVVGVYIANAAGAPSGPDVAAVFAAIQALSTPLSVTVTVAAVGTVPLNVLYNVFVKQSTGLSAAQVLANIDSALTAFCQATPIGGYTTSAPNIVPYDELIDVIINANPGTLDLQLNNPGGNLPIGPTSVPVLGTTQSTSANVFFV